MTTYTTRPLSDRSWLDPRKRRPTRFTATWADTLALLGSEVDALRGKRWESLQRAARAAGLAS